MRQAGEPSVEEILESIKKVIARDNRVGAAEQRSRRETVVSAPDSFKTIALELEEDEDVLDLAESAALAEEEDDYDTSEAESLEAPLITDDARGSMRESLAALAMLAQPGVPPQIVRSGETSLEGIARELLRPALAEWLDKNLPQMVERMVAGEIARIVGKKG
jgi:cell pole-organizing protein PopZ